MVRLYNPESVTKLYFKEGAELTLGTFECARNTLFVLPSRVSNPTAWTDGQVLRGGELIYRSDLGSLRYYNANTSTWVDPSAGGGGGTASTGRIFMLMGA